MEIEPRGIRSRSIGWIGRTIIAGYLLSPLPAVADATATYTTPSQEALGAAIDAMASLEKAMRDGAAILEGGSLPAIDAQGRDLSALVGASHTAFGSTASEPLGRCGTAGTWARAWWQARISAANGDGREPVPGEIKSALERYQEDRAECLAAANPIAMRKTSGGNNECLPVFRYDPVIKDIVALPKPADCQTQ